MCIVKVPMTDLTDLTDGGELKRIYDLFKKEIVFKKEYDIIRSKKSLFSIFKRKRYGNV